MFSFRYTSGVRKHKKTIGLLSYRMGQKSSSELLFIYSPNKLIDGFYRFTFHKVV